MKFAVAIALAATLLAIPLLCVLLPCAVTAPTHECCPQSRAVSMCPYDVLDQAKAPKPHIVLAIEATSFPVSPIGLPAPQHGLQAASQFLFDGRDLHIRNRVLLV
jgi:hypothetical protein